MLPYPLAEGWRAAPKVHGDVEDLTGDHPHEFSLGLLNLVVQAAEDVARGAGVVVLDEGAGAAGRTTEFVFAERLHEEAAGVRMDHGFEDEDVGDGGGDDVHVLRLTRSKRRRSIRRATSPGLH